MVLLWLFLGMFQSRERSGSHLTGPLLRLKEVTLYSHLSSQTVKITLPMLHFVLLIDDFIV